MSANTVIVSLARYKRARYPVAKTLNIVRFSSREWWGFGVFVFPVNVRYTGYSEMPQDLYCRIRAHKYCVQQPLVEIITNHNFLGRCLINHNPTLLTGVTTYLVSSSRIRQPWQLLSIPLYPWGLVSCC